MTFNLIEGFRRIYFLFSAVMLLFGAVLLWQDLPTQSRFERETAMDIMNFLAVGEKSEGFTLRYGQHGAWSDTRIIQFYCQPSRPYVAACIGLQEKTGSLWKEQFKYVLTAVGYLVCGAFCLYVLWLAFSWVAKGFMPSPTAVPPKS